MIQFFDVNDCKTSIVRPGMDLTRWVKQYKPFAVCNASLYDFKTGIPVGTIIENGKRVRTEGDYYGFGTIDSKPYFGVPKDRSWEYFLAGYNAPIQNGNYVAPPWRDDYVFNSKNYRIGIGVKDGKLVIFTDEGVTLKQFANNALTVGAKTLVNLDGGGSRHLYYNGKHIFKSTRIPYNAIAFFKEGSAPKKDPEICPWPEPYRNIRKWCIGNDCKWVQYMLNQHGAQLVVDGFFYGQSDEALRKFQYSTGLVADGICGPKTRERLKQ